MLAVPTGSASATGNPRNKVALTPGHSLLDWIKLGKSGKDLTGVGGRRLDVTTEELAKHCSQEDAWTAIKGSLTVLLSNIIIIIIIVTVMKDEIYVMICPKGLHEHVT